MPYLSPITISSLEASTKHIPHFLFRTSSESSRGRNSASQIVPDATLAGRGHESILLIPVDEAKTMLQEHFLWNYDYMSEFTSWSSSLLFALQHAVRKADFRRESNVCIYTLDTRKVRNCQIYPATTLLRIYGIENAGKLKHEYYTSEYLAHGKLDCSASSAVVRLQDLIGNGLYEQFEELNDMQEKRYLYRRVQDLRTLFFMRTSEVTDSELASLQKLGLCFGIEFALPVSMAFLSLRRRSGPDGFPLHAIMQGFRGIIPDGYLDDEFLTAMAEEISDSLPEVKQYLALMKEIRVARNTELLNTRLNTSNDDDIVDRIRQLDIHPRRASNAEELDNLCDECETYVEEDSWDTDDEAEEANTNDDLIKMIEGDS